MKLALRHVCCVAGIVVASPIASASWTETFDNGSFDQTWSFGQATFAGDVSSYTPSLVSDQMRLESSFDPSDQFSNIESVYGSVVTETFSDGRVTANVSSSSSNFYGIGGRGDGVANAYTLLYDPEAQGLLFLRVRNGNGKFFSSELPENSGPIDFSTLLPEDVIDGLGLPTDLDTTDFTSVSGVATFLDFRMYGSYFYGEAYDVEGGTRLDAILVHDTTGFSFTTAGYAGVFTTVDQYAASPDLIEGIDTVYDSVTASALPEPTTLALAGFAGLGLLGRRASGRA